ncbi:MAG TPA: hypothetical protein VI643_07925 [Planctomycetota bacterium]|nr:hypothetical protein [Planctomycetota bacterium]
MAPILLAAILAQDSSLDLPNDVTRIHELGASSLLAAGRDNLTTVDLAGWKIAARSNVNSMKGERFIGVAAGLVVTASYEGVFAFGPDLKLKWTSPSKENAVEAVEASGGVLVLVQDRVAAGGVAQSGRLLDAASGAAKASLDPGFANSWLWWAERDLFVFGEKEKQETDAGRVVAFNGSGQKVWEIKLGKARRAGVSGRAILAAEAESGGGTTLRAYDAKNGKALFFRQAGAGVGCVGPAGELAFVYEQSGSSGSKLTALELGGAGKEKWTATLPVGPRRVLEVGGHLVVETSRATFGIDASNGARKWELKRTEIYSTTSVGTDVFVPVVDAGGKARVLLADWPEAGRPRKVKLVDPETGAAVQEIEVPNEELRTARVVGSRLVYSAQMKLFAAALGGK